MVDAAGGDPRSSVPASGVTKGDQPRSAAGVARGVQARDPGLSPTSTRRTVPKMDSGASALAPILDGSTAGELIPELVRHGLQQLIELEVTAVLGADRHERSEERVGYRNGYRPRLLTSQVGDINLQIPKLRAAASCPRPSNRAGGWTMPSTPS